MFKWFKSKSALAQGMGAQPDFSSIDSPDKAQALYRHGELQKLLLLPAAFGGQDTPLNVVFVPEFVTQLKARIDHDMIRPLAVNGQVTRYQAVPEYQGRSVIPASIRISASEPGSFTTNIAIWGRALKPSDEAVGAT